LGAAPWADAWPDDPIVSNATAASLENVVSAGIFCIVSSLWNLIESAVGSYASIPCSLTKLYASGDIRTRFENYVMVMTRQTASATEQEMTMRGRRTSIAIFAAVALGIVGAASVAQAGGSDNWNDSGGYVVPGSMSGVNPVFHPGWFGRSGSAGDAYGYAVLPIHRHRPVHEQSRER
jgi:hypothetical protein